jgi:hypothetical protein
MLRLSTFHHSIFIDPGILNLQGQREWIFSTLISLIFEIYLVMVLSFALRGTQRCGSLNLNKLLRISLEIDKYPIHIRPMQVCEILQVHKLGRLSELIQGFADWVHIASGSAQISN